MQYFFDSNIFLRYFTDEKNSKVFKDCSALIKKIKLGKTRAVTSHLVTAEIVWTLFSSYRASKDQVVKVLKVIETLNGLKMLDNVNTAKANNLFISYHVKYIDALIASYPEIQSKKMVVVSYDKDFDKLGVKRLEPSDIINRD
ncbi:MAG: PIN domain-containing protein [bacterium]|nr:PIN domain-containing protein [bacterium]